MLWQNWCDCSCMLQTWRGIWEHNNHSTVSSCQYSRTHRFHSICMEGGKWNCFLIGGSNARDLQVHAIPCWLYNFHSSWDETELSDFPVVPSYAICFWWTSLDCWTENSWIPRVPQSEYSMCIYILEVLINSSWLSVSV